MYLYIENTKSKKIARKNQMKIGWLIKNELHGHENSMTVHK